MDYINTDLAPEAIGTYSQAVRHGDTVYISGQIPLLPESMQLCSAEIREQIIQVMENLSKVAEAAGGSLSHIVKLNVYLTDLSHFPLVNEIMSHYFKAPYPARAAIGVVALPRDAQVEIDAVMAADSKVSID